MQSTSLIRNSPEKSCGKTLTISDSRDETSGGQHVSPNKDMHQWFSYASRRPGGGVTAGHRRGWQQDAATVATSLAMRKGNLPEAL
jgi:hypothetical protein